VQMLLRGRRDRFASPRIFVSENLRRLFDHFIAALKRNDERFAAKSQIDGLRGGPLRCGFDPSGCAGRGTGRRCRRPGRSLHGLRHQLGHRVGEARGRRARPRAGRARPLHRRPRRLWPYAGPALPEPVPDRSADHQVPSFHLEAVGLNRACAGAAVRRHPSRGHELRVRRGH
jgi:hypothetical protein